MARAGGGEAKVEEVKPHPVMDQIPGIQYCVNSPPPWPEALLLGFQHYLLTLGITILIPSITVPQMGGSNAEKAKVIQTLLFVSGLNTLLQSLFGTRLPSVISGSYSFLIPTTSIIQAKRYSTLQEHERFEQTMRGIQGALIVTSCFQMIIGFLGLWRNVVRLLSPLSMVPLVTFAALGLYQLGFSLLSTCIEVGLPELILMVIISQYVPCYVKTKRRIYDRFAMLFSVAMVWIYAEILTASGAYKRSTDRLSNCRTDHAGLIDGAPWFYIPYPFQWGPPTFRTGEAFAMMAASFVASIESTGTFLAAARYGSATPVPPSVISRGAGWLGVGTFLNGVLGSVTGTTASVPTMTLQELNNAARFIKRTNVPAQAFFFGHMPLLVALSVCIVRVFFFYSENAGLLALTRAGSRRVIQISAGYMIFFSVLGKFGAFFASIPLPAIAALYCIFFAYVSSAGLGFLQYCNLNSFRTKFILGLSFFLGLSVPQYFKEYQLGSGSVPAHTHSRWFNDMMSVIFMSHAMVAAIVALFLDCTLSRGDDETRKDSGSHWWEKFLIYNTDVRSDDFYALPYKLNKFFPPL